MLSRVDPAINQLKTKQSLAWNILWLFCSFHCRVAVPVSGAADEVQESVWLAWLLIRKSPYSLNTSLKTPPIYSLVFLLLSHRSLLIEFLKGFRLQTSMIFFLFILKEIIVDNSKARIFNTQRKYSFLYSKSKVTYH